MKTIVSACIGLAISAAIMLVLGVLIVALIWWMFHHNMDFGDLINSEEWEEQK